MERDYGRSEQDVAGDAAEVTTRPAGGDADRQSEDANSTTGTTPNEEFVGRASGTDVGSDEETGAEARARAERDAEQG